MKLTFEKSRPIVIVPYQVAWANEFKQIGKALREDVLGDSILRVDHIGSTSVPNLAAKDVIDIQISIENLQANDFKSKLLDAGYALRSEITHDLITGFDNNDSQLQKLFCREKAGDRRTHIHIREVGRINQKYPLLFRDYLRANDLSRNIYEQLKIRLSHLFPESIEGYLYFKDPLMDLIYDAARNWAKATNWQLDEAYL